MLKKCYGTIPQSICFERGSGFSHFPELHREAKSVPFDI